ncbi:ABC transporter substrate-binding protein [Rhizobium sp. RM]|uniref:ABC transporter substrate-binding protein n=1 Tax=Rhizobium sp. RM TaxID=2748079 RepID=UPI00110DE186|nr:ABC transporter substrate-binding protein [Rhizobium sp. RM]NWJ27266.1 ABC transporter substrate-binding protein [Rhizobium sp. RM]TMV20327.1 iron-siderophore ABC transporter substrate-binding protein [Rhizobium sp. Td3]
MPKIFYSLLFVTGLIYGTIAAKAEEPARMFTDDLGRSVSVPAQPKRIVTLHDIDLTIPLIELGVIPVGSHGRMGADGKPYLRSSAILTGIDFDNSDIAYIGSINADLEAIVALKPDLILTEPDRPTAIEKLEKIAPTVAIDNTRDGAPHIYKMLADLTGTQQRLAVLDRRYRAQIDALKASVDTDKITVSVMQPLNGKISVYHTYRALGRVLRDAGFRFPAIIDAIPEGDRLEISAERLPELDADIIFDPYRSDTGASPKEEISMMEAVMPGFCDFLEACRKSRYILLPREEAISNSYAALSLMVSAVQSHLTIRPATAN